MNNTDIITKLRIAMTDARENESHFESWMILNEAICDAIDALAEQSAPATEFREQEPVAHFGSAYVNENGVHITTVLGPVAIPQDAKLYTSPPAQRKPLTDEEIWKFWWARPEVPDGEDDSMEAEFVASVRAVLAAHGIKGDA